jgi:hypothetical protein
MGISNAVTSLLSEVDERTVAVELARLALETAREALERARGALDETLSKGDALGLPKGRLKKLGEDRLLALIDLGALPVSRGGVMTRVRHADSHTVVPAIRRRRTCRRADVPAQTRADNVDQGDERSALSVVQAAAERAEIDTVASGVVATVEVVDASAIDDSAPDAVDPSPAAWTSTVIDIGTIDFDAIEGMDEAAAAAIHDLTAEAVDGSDAEFEAELSRAERALKAA